MDSRIKYMLLKTVQDSNILPVTSVCNMACKFCSHRFNPPGVEVFSFGHLSLELIEELIDYLPEEGAVIIGESATRIIEGDPFTHPDILKIIKMIRSKFASKPIYITTHGSYFTEEIIQELAYLKPIEFNISINCSTPEERVFLMGDKTSENLFQALELIQENELAFNGSIVAMPHIMGWESLHKTFDLLSEYSPRTVRVYMPGFTRKTEKSLRFNPEKIHLQLSKFIEMMQDKYKFPILLEPPILKDFNCEIKDIIPDSPAALSGFKRNDIMLSLNGSLVQTRVEAFDRILKEENPDVSVNRTGETIKIRLNKFKNQRPGLVMDRDLAIDTINKIYHLIARPELDRIGIITSKLARYLINSLINQYKREFSAKKIDVIVAENCFFGGSIMSAGLLTNFDIINVLQKQEKKYDLIILPGIIYDIFGNDLTGENYKKIEEETGSTVELV